MTDGSGRGSFQDSGTPMREGGRLIAEIVWMDVNIVADIPGLLARTAANYNETCYEMFVPTTESEA